MPAWPASLPQQPLKRGYGATPQDQTISTEPDAGAPLVRRRFSAGGTTHHCIYKMTTTQRGTFETWWRDTIKAGALSFDWPHPEDGTTTVTGLLRPATYSIDPAPSNDRWLVKITVFEKP